jgi:hypothetical protein
LARDPRRARHDGGISQDDLDLLVSVLPQTGIEHLSLAFNRIGDNGLSLLADGLHGTKLTSLDLETASINAVGAIALANVLERDETNLSHINFSNNNVGGAAEALVIAAKAHSRLHQIGDEGTAVRLQP